MICCNISIKINATKREIHDYYLFQSVSSSEASEAEAALMRAEGAAGENKPEASELALGGGAAAGAVGTRLLQVQ